MRKGVWVSGTRARARTPTATAAAPPRRAPSSPLSQRRPVWHWNHCPHVTPHRTLRLSSAVAAKDLAEAAKREAQVQLEDQRSRHRQKLADQRKGLREAEQQLIDARASLMRTEAEASALTLETTSARDQMETERDGAVAEAADQRQRREAAEQATEAYDDKSLAAIAQYLAPGDVVARARADAPLKVKSLNSAAALETNLQSNEHYKRAIRTLIDSLTRHVADGQADRIGLLESAVAEHLEKRSRKRARESSSAADKANVSPDEPLLGNLANM